MMSNVSLGKANLYLSADIVSYDKKPMFIPQKCNILLPGYRLPTGDPPHTHTHSPTLRHFSWPFPPVLPSIFTPERAGQTGWLTVNQKVFFCSVILSLQGGTPPSSAPNKTGFLYQPHSNSKVPKHYVQGAFIPASSTHPACPPARPPTRPLQSVHTTRPRHYQTLTMPWCSHAILRAINRQNRTSQK